MRYPIWTLFQSTFGQLGQIDRVRFCTSLHIPDNKSFAMHVKSANRSQLCNRLSPCSVTVSHASHLRHSEKNTNRKLAAPKLCKNISNRYKNLQMASCDRHPCMRSNLTVYTLRFRRPLDDHVHHHWWSTSLLLPYSSLHIVPKLRPNFSHRFTRKSSSTIRNVA